MQEGKHRWTYYEDKYCCQQFVEYYVINKSNMDTETFVALLQKELHEIKLASLRMKIGNIKFLLSELKVHNTSPCQFLPHYSMQNMQAMKDVLHENGIAGF